MARLAFLEKLQRAIALRDAAVDLVAQGGKMTPGKAGDRTIEIPTYDEGRIAILYKSLLIDLRDDRAPPHINPKGYMVDIWFDNRKRISVQWNENGPVDILMYKPGDWETEFLAEHRLRRGPDR